MSKGSSATKSESPRARAAARSPAVVLRSLLDGVAPPRKSAHEGGRWIPALDACYRALALAPADPELHLLLAEIYEARGWAELGSDKLLLLVRLADVTGDPDIRGRACTLGAALYPGEPRLAAVCG